MRSRVIQAVSAAGFLWMAVAANGLAAPHAQKVCGIVVSVECSRYPPNTPSVMTLLVETGIAADVEATTEADAQSLRPVARGLFLQRACVTGKMVAKQNPEHAGRLVVDATAVITPDGAGPADWSGTDLHSSCEPDVIGPKPVKHRPQSAQARLEALQNGVQGRAIFQVIVAADGTVENVRLVKTLDAMYGANRYAEEFIKGTTFEPATKAGVPVRFTMLYTYGLSMAP